MTIRTLHSSTVHTRYQLTSDYLQNQVHATWYTMLYGALRAEIDEEGHEYTKEELVTLALAAAILSAKR